MIKQNYQGYILAAHPNRPDLILHHSVILVTDHNKSGAIGLQLNKPHLDVGINFNSVMQSMGLSAEESDPSAAPLYIGGTQGANGIHIIHTNDWVSSTTRKINDQICVSSDISIVAAIHQKTGPKQYRAVAGYTRWMPGHLEREIKESTIERSWSFAVATELNVFECSDNEQWHRAIDDSNKLQISLWF